MNDAVLRSPVGRHTSVAGSWCVAIPTCLLAVAMRNERGVSPVRCGNWSSALCGWRADACEVVWCCGDSVKGREKSGKLRFFV
jgi:hypothetical protein